MSPPSSSKNSLTTWLFIAAGLILLLAGALSLLPSISAASEVTLESTPADFGEETLPLLPTVTPPPRPSQITPEPVLLPDNSSSSSAAPSVPVRRPLPVDSKGETPTRIVIPAIKLDAPVETAAWHTVNGISQWDVPDHFAAGWLMTSATLGKSGNTAITGHHNMAGEVFRNLVKLQRGDQVIIYGDDKPYFYEVTARKILPERGQPDEVRLANARWIQPTTDERITLTTCWPYTSNTHRLIIIAKPMALEDSRKSIEP